MANVEEDRVRRIENLVARLEALADPEARETGEALMQAVLELHGAGLERMMDLAFESGQAGQALMRRFAADDLVGNLLILHNLHPDDLETRVHQLLPKLPGHAEPVGVFEGLVRVRVDGGTDVQNVTALMRQSLPDAKEIIVETRAKPNGLVPLASLTATTLRTA